MTSDQERIALLERRILLLEAKLQALQEVIAMPVSDELFTHGELIDCPCAQATRQ